MKKQTKCSIPLSNDYLGTHDRAKLEEVAKVLNACVEKCGCMGRVELEIWETVRIHGTEPPATHVEILANFDDDVRWRKIRGSGDGTCINSAKWLTPQQKGIVELFYFITRRLASADESIMDIPGAGEFKLNVIAPLELF